MDDFFGDDDPEDAYSVEDPPLERLRVARLWVASIALEAAREHDRARLTRRIQEARWAVGLLKAVALPRAKREVRIFLSKWLDELLAEHG